MRKLLDGKADAYVMDKNAEVMEAHKGLPIEYSSSNFSMSTQNIDKFHQRMLQREWHQAEQREINVEKIVYKAMEKVKDVTDVGMQKPDQDWLLRFFTSAQDIGTEEMQNIWADVLAGTAKNSKSYSLRTLSTLHSMSKEDAEIFMKVCSHRVTIANNVLIPRYEGIFSDSSILYDDILHLSECGLINSSGNISLNFEISNSKDAFYLMFNDKYILEISSKRSKATFEIPQYPLTIPGKELSTLFEQKVSLEESKKFAISILENNKIILNNYFMYEITNITDDGQIEHNPIPIVKM